MGASTGFTRLIRFAGRLNVAIWHYRSKLRRKKPRRSFAEGCVDYGAFHHVNLPTWAGGIGEES
jgi:hypothetical protein